jgi:hypothetical protein
VAIANKSGIPSFVTPQVNLTGGGGWTEVCRVQTTDIRGGRVLLDGIVGAGAALTGLKIVQNVAGAPDRDVYGGTSQSDWLTPSQKVPVILPSSYNVGNTPAGSWFQIEVEVGAADQIALFAQCATNTSVTVSGEIKGLA